MPGCTRTTPGCAYTVVTLFVLFVVVPVGCGSARGFNRGVLRQRLAEETPEITYDAIQTAFELKPQLPSGYKLGVFFNDPKKLDPSYSWHPAPPQYWPGDAKDVLLGMESGLRDKGVVSDMFVVTPIEACPDLLSIRLAAARQGADAVLLVNGAMDVDEHNNGWSTTYALLLPALFMPGNELDALYMTTASLWDVRNGFLYLTAESEATAHQTRAPLYIHESSAIAKARREAMEGLRDELIPRLELAAGIVRSD